MSLIRWKFSEWVIFPKTVLLLEDFKWKVVFFLNLFSSCINDLIPENGGMTDYPDKVDT